MRPALLLLVALLLATPVLVGCSSAPTPPLPRFLRGDDRAEVPGQYAGGSTQPGTVPPSAAAPEIVRAGDALFARAAATQDFEDKADIYGDIVSDYPQHPRASEARYLQGLNFYRAGAWASAIETLKEYMFDAPVNPHVGDVEEMLYQSGLRYVASDRGVLGIFDDNSTGLEAIRYVPVGFPAGKYADDAILYLARYWRDDGDLQRASLYYKELLLRYPDSEWSFEARRELGATYAARDVGDVYHAGFVDRDPREEVPSDDPKAAAQAGPVRSSLEMAIAEYDKYLERIARDPGRQAEYAQRVREVEAEKARLRERLARKDERIAAWYAGQGDPRAADVYRRSAAALRRGATSSPIPILQPEPTPTATTPPVVQPPVRQPPRGFPTRPPPPSETPPSTTPPGSRPQPPSPTPAPTIPYRAAPSSGAGVPPPPPPPSWPAGR